MVLASINIIGWFDLVLVCKDIGFKQVLFTVWSKCDFEAFKGSNDKMIVIYRYIIFAKNMWREHHLLILHSVTIVYKTSKSFIEGFKLDMFNLNIHVSYYNMLLIILIAKEIPGLFMSKDTIKQQQTLLEILWK